MKIRLGAALAVCLALASFTAAVTLGHASLVSSDPAQGATILSPYTVTATFDEELTPNGSSLVIQTASGAQVASGTVSTSDDKSMTADLPHETDGQYTALWTAVTADDNGVTRGTFTFTVGSPIPGSGAPATAAPTPAPSATNGSASGGGNDVLIALVLAVVIIGGVAGFVLYRESTLTGLAGLPQPQALIFDLDGTLVDTVETRIEAWLRTFDEEEIPADRDHVASLIGADGKKLAREVAQRAGRELSAADQERIDQRSGAIYDEINTNPTPTAGAHSLLLALEQSSLKWAIATSSRAEQTKVSIAALELPETPLIVDGSHVEHAKPAPDLLLLAAHKLKERPTRCWYVGDSTWDMRASLAARMVAVGVAYGAALDSELIDAGADVVTTLGDLESDLRERGLLRT